MRQATIKTCSAILTALLWLFCFPAIGSAQEIVDVTPVDTVVVVAPDSLTQAVLQAADSAFASMPEVPKQAFKPNSTKSVLFALVPGMGQIYNRKYWKLPLVYGGFMGFMYAVTWNNKMYQDYWQGYKSMMNDADAYQKALNAANGEQVDFNFSNEWLDLMAAGTDPKQTVLNKTQQDRLKNNKNYYRRYRDLSIILTVGFYALTLIDAYVDAELFNFDVSPDLSMRIEPAYSPQTRYSSRNIGFNCSITF
ncbi:hypothetical protein M2459_003151 [Parabacteroides sp. PF5-5]|uniref:DUF5683 domain-containing protein n=1 Tax=unclassified Parabacteroides TaxID=2649774 RepID=UPI002474CC7B|nr:MULTISPECIES: DUF5683 domain-containing protein [unclassified Parabacteroides]MDH6306427.1 hypothetical protein [Parabacteroides sp. PH5-39]MDH6317421.1 hypothetical protein [Parabacteroides sp. PF5-13]MDH6321138.1 hypothetical protein [Parabacteroides sp. PH5-13]MDH6324870.1 hypothetical protein [Parabacteroides sp. PH5-8]MDH6328606.1 hypothetical protein [Parabacteroides sp. PH5-41]